MDLIFNHNEPNGMINYLIMLIRHFSVYINKKRYRYFGYPSDITRLVVAKMDVARFNQAREVYNLLMVVDGDKPAPAAVIKKRVSFIKDFMSETMVFSPAKLRSIYRLKRKHCTLDTLTILQEGYFNLLPHDYKRIIIEHGNQGL